MIGEGRFQAQLSTVEKVLKTLGLLEERAISPNKELGATHFRGLNYRQVYESCFKEYVYDFRLADQSLLLFIKGGRNQHNGFLSFCCYECPVRAVTYVDFVAAEFGLSSLDIGFADKVAIWGDDLRGEYEQYVTSTESKNLVTPIRYDYRASDYQEGIHPASHIHFGFENEIRIGTRRILNPISFVLLLIRQRYPKKWEELLALELHKTWCRNVRDGIDKVDEVYWKQLDYLELALH